MDLIPCDTCLKFPICMNIKEIDCQDLFIFLYTHVDKCHTTVDLTGGNRNLKRSYKVESLYQKAILGVKRLSYSVVFSERTKGEKI
jgi:hypothetical protein